MRKFPKILAIALLSLGCIMPMAACERSIATDDNEPTRQRGVEETPNLTDEMPNLPDFSDFTEQEDERMPAPPAPHGGRGHGRKCPPPPPKGDTEKDGDQKDEDKEEDDDGVQDEKTTQKDELPGDGKRPVKPMPKPIPKPKHTHASKQL